jgi:PD-(D/E)XK endonuclease
MDARRLTTDQKGAIAEAAVVVAALKEGLEVYRPVAEGGRYDLILGTPSGLLRVQVKWANLRRSAVVVRTYSCRRGATGMIVRKYSEDQIDAFAGYCAALDRCYLVPARLAVAHREIWLRVEPARNNQQVGIRWAQQFEFRSINWEHLGAIAQLEERLHGMQEVAGSSPASSTHKAA